MEYHLLHGELASSGSQPGLCKANRTGRSLWGDLCRWKACFESNSGLALIAGKPVTIRRDRFPRNNPGHVTRPLVGSSVSSNSSWQAA